MSFGPYKYWDNGTSFCACTADYEAQTGEAVFTDTPTPAQLSAAFPGYAAAATEQATAALVQAFTQAAQNLLDSTAQQKDYDGILSLCSYASSTNATFKAQALAGVEWRDAVWAEGYSILAQVQANTLAQPTIPAFLAMLPAMVWPS